MAKSMVRSGLVSKIEGAYQVRQSTRADAAIYEVRQRGAKAACDCGQDDADVRCVHVRAVKFYVSAENDRRARERKAS